MSMATTASLEVRAAVEAARATVVAAHAAVGLVWSHNKAAARALRAAEALSRTAVALLTAPSPAPAPAPAAPRKRRQRRKPETAATKSNEELPAATADKAPANEAATVCAAAGADTAASAPSAAPAEPAEPACFAAGDKVLVTDGTPLRDLIGGVCEVVEQGLNKDHFRLKVPKERAELLGRSLVVVHTDYLRLMPAGPGPPSGQRRRKGAATLGGPDLQLRGCELESLRSRGGAAR